MMIYLPWCRELLILFFYELEGSTHKISGDMTTKISSEEVIELEILLLQFNWFVSICIYSLYTRLRKSNLIFKNNIIITVTLIDTSKTGRKKNDTLWFAEFYEIIILFNLTLFWYHQLFYNILYHLVFTNVYIFIRKMCDYLLHFKINTIPTKTIFS